nr:MAG TPA: hypothetical protein [Caudoviricetes sp.]
MQIVHKNGPHSIHLRITSRARASGLFAFLRLSAMFLPTYWFLLWGVLLRAPWPNNDG